MKRIMLKISTEEICKLYQNGHSQPEIAEIAGTYQGMIHNRLKEAGLQCRDLSMAHKLAFKKGRHKPVHLRGKLHGNYKHGKSSVVYRAMIAKEKCENCGTTENLGIHHKNNDHYDNNPENLQILCVSCHLSLHKKAWWAAKKAGLPTPKSNGPMSWKHKSVS